MPQNHTLNIPADGNLTAIVGDTVTISFQDDRSWCFSDPDNVFAEGILPTGPRSRGYQSPAYKAVNPGTVQFNSAGREENCNPNGGTAATPHSIVVTNVNL